MTVRTLLEQSHLMPAAKWVAAHARQWQAWAGTAWARSQAVDAAELMRRSSPGLWEEAVLWATSFEPVAGGETLAQLREHQIGGPAYLPVLHFLVRVLRPTIVVETGVAAGWSSAAILAAMDKNEHGHLWSSDLGYVVRGAASVDFAPGFVVPDVHRRRWTLMEGPDETNIPAILRSVDRVDLVHYDSDKRARARNRTLRMLLPSMAGQAAIIVDDAGDNLQFARFSRRSGWSRSVVTAPNGKAVGIMLCGLPSVTDGPTWTPDVD